MKNKPCIIIILFMMGCSAIAHNPCPLTEDVTMVGLPVKDTAVELLQEFSFSVFWVHYKLPKGIYIPAFQDDHGIFYRSPTPIIEVRGDNSRQLNGGIHIPKKMGRYYSFPSLYVYFGESLRLCGLPNDFIRAQNKMWGIAYRDSIQPN